MFFIFILKILCLYSIKKINNIKMEIKYENYKYKNIMIIKEDELCIQY